MRLWLAAAALAAGALAWHAHSLSTIVASQTTEIKSLTAALAAQSAERMLAAQTECAVSATRFLTSRGWKPEVGSTYENHFNKKLNRCFILVSEYLLNEDFRMIDVYDAIEGRHYAAYHGHNICDVGITKSPSKCALDSGSIWFDGNDTRNPADVVFGFRGLRNGGGSGDGETQKLFIERIQALMNQ